MKKDYEIPEMEVLFFTTLEVITTSGGTGSDNWYVPEVPGVDDFE